MKKKICLYSSPFGTDISYTEMIDLAAELGIGGVEVMNGRELASRDPEAARKLRTHADSKGIQIPCFSVYADLVGEKAEQTEKNLKECAELCTILGSPYLHHTAIPYCSGPERVFAHGEEFYQKAVSAIRRITDHAASLGVRTVYEDQGYILNGREGFGRLLEEVNRDVGVVADLGNIYQVDELPEDFIDAFSAKVVHVHIKDVGYQPEGPVPEFWMATAHGGAFTTCAPGGGVVDFPRCIRKLTAAGYDGWYALEFCVRSGKKEELSAHIDRIAEWIEKGE